MQSYQKPERDGNNAAGLFFWPGISDNSPTNVSLTPATPFRVPSVKNTTCDTATCQEISK